MLTKRMVNLSINWRKLFSAPNLKHIDRLSQVKSFKDHAKLMSGLHDKKDKNDRFQSKLSYVKSASLVLDLLEFNFNDPNLNGSDTIKALTKLLQLCKQENRPPEKVIYEDFFKNLCNLINSQANDLTFSEAIQIMDLLRNLEVPSSSTVISVLLGRIDILSNTASLGDCNEIIQIITKMPSLPSTRALKARLMKKFIFKISTELDRNNFSFLVEALRFACFHMKDEEVLKTIIAALKTNNFDTQSPHSILSLIKTLNQPKYHSKEFDEILIQAQNAFIINIEQINNKEIPVVLGMACTKLKSQSLEQFYNQTLFDKAIQKLISTECDLDDGIHCLEASLGVKHTSRELLDYLTGKMYVEIEIDGKSIKDSMLFSMFEGFANLKYKPFCWQTFLDVFRSFDFSNYTAKTLLYRAYHLACLDCYEPKILETVFKKNLTILRKDPSNFFLLQLYQKLKTVPDYTGPLPSQRQIDSFEYLTRTLTAYPLYTSLTEALGGPEYVKTNILTKLYHQIDHVIAFQPGGDPFPVNDNKNRELTEDSVRSMEYLEDLNIPENCQIVAVILTPRIWYSRNTNQMLGTFATYFETLETLSCQAVAVSEKVWQSLPKDSRTGFLIDIVKSKLNGNKKSDVELVH